MILKTMIMQQEEGKTMFEYIREMRGPLTLSIWGEKCEDTFSPVLVPEILGDGMQLITIGSGCQRPYFWLVRIDSQTDIRDCHFSPEPIIEAIEGEFGHAPWWVDGEEAYKNDIDLVERYETYTEYMDAYNEPQYPAIKWDGGHYASIANVGYPKQ
jgi:hypothetical protein